MAAGSLPGPGWSQAGLPELCLDGLLSARLYTGPMGAKYNAALVRRRDPAAREPAEMAAQRGGADLCLGNEYALTLHTLNSALLKLGRVQRAEKVYRAVVGGALPAEFSRPDAAGVRGGVELGFLSATTEFDVALSYASAGRAGAQCTLLEIEQGMVDRGASLSWLSQYPHEGEVAFPPLTALTASSVRVDGPVVCVKVAAEVVRGPAEAHQPQPGRPQPGRPQSVADDPSALQSAAGQPAVAVGGQQPASDPAASQRNAKSEEWARSTGTLQVELLRATDLKAMDRNGLSDPYVKLQLSGQKHRSKTVKKTLNPTWHERFEFTGKSLRDIVSQPLQLRAMDWDRGLQRDDILGDATVDLGGLLLVCNSKEALMRDWHLELDAPLSTQGRVVLRARWRPNRPAGPAPVSYSDLIAKAAQPMAAAKKQALAAASRSQSAAECQRQSERPAGSAPAPVPYSGLTTAAGSQAVGAGAGQEALDKEAKEKASAYVRAAREKAAADVATMKEKAAREKEVAKRSSIRERARGVATDAGASLDFGHGKTPAAKENETTILKLRNILLDPTLGRTRAAITGPCAASEVSRGLHIARAESVLAALVKEGVPRDRLEVATTGHEAGDVCGKVELHWDD